MLSEDRDINSLVSLFHGYLGKYYLPPFWGLGFHQSRWGLSHVQESKLIIQQYSAHQLPMDSYFFDIDALAQKQSFTLDYKFSAY